MKQIHILLLAAMMVAIPAARGWSQPLRYEMTVSSGFPMAPAGTIVFQGGPGSRGVGFDNQVTTIPIGFTFRFDTTDYTSLWLNTNGLVGFGATPSNSGANDFQGSLPASSYPIITAYWDSLHFSGGQGVQCGNQFVSYSLLGTAPNRALVLRWNDLELYNRGLNLSKWEVRLYETSNIIEFFYENMRNSDPCKGNVVGCQSASTGIATSTSRFLSISRSTGIPLVSSTFNETNINIGKGCGAVTIPLGELITFAPCSLQANGLTGPDNGAPGSQISNGTQLFSGLMTQIGNTRAYRPISLRMSGGTCSDSYTMAITGAAASDYTFTSNNQRSISGALAAGRIDTIGITFTPTATGVRNATLTITNPNGFSRVLNLAAEAPFVNYIGNPAQSGTPQMLTGDTILNRVLVRRYASQSFQPFALQNMSPTPALISYAITGGGGQYAINAPPAGGLLPGQFIAPAITFSPAGVGPVPATLAVPATLTVTAAGQSRSFTLYGISVAPGGIITYNSVVLDSNTQLFNNQYSCVGETPFTYTFEVTNVGFGDFEIGGLEAYENDTSYRQGGGYRTLRDAGGRLIPMADYSLTDAATGGHLGLPVVVPQGGNQRIAITFVGTRSGKRFASVYIRTNGQNSSGLDTSNRVIEGIFDFVALGRGTGSSLSDNIIGGAPRTVVFPMTKVGDTSRMTITIANTGECQMRLSLNALRIATGDAREFTVETMPRGSIDPATNDLLIAPHTANSTMVVAFSPRRTGSRRATMRQRTNDSSLRASGYADHGVNYLDLFGSSPTILSASSLDLGIALAGGTATDRARGTIHLENTTDAPISIAKIDIDGTDRGDFMEDPAAKWPALPREILPGERLDLGIVFGPNGTAPGGRAAILKLHLADGDSVLATLSGSAGTRTISLTPNTMNFNAALNGSRLNRQTIAITNTGTMPLHLSGPVLSASLKGAITIGALPRLVLDAGQTEYLELTCNADGSAVGNTLAGTLSFSSDATNLPVATVTISTTTTKTRRNDDGAAPTAITGRSGARANMVAGSQSVSGAETTTEADGVKLWQSVPNPGTDLVEIRYQLSNSGRVMLGLYDEAGRLIRVLDTGIRDAGEQRIHVDVRNLASGIYHYVLTVGTRRLNHSLQVVH
ncbi:MAG: hypothetical protein JWQ98_2060 [Chlorobi bacterium]|nr:hypothetical protein [Chlorobiota bacterium]